MSVNLGLPNSGNPYLASPIPVITAPKPRTSSSIPRLASQALIQNGRSQQSPNNLSVLNSVSMLHPSVQQNQMQEKLNHSNLIHKMITPIEVKNFENSIENLKPQEQMAAWYKFGLDMGFSFTLTSPVIKQKDGQNYLVNESSNVLQKDFEIYVKTQVAQTVLFFREKLEQDMRDIMDSNAIYAKFSIGKPVSLDETLLEELSAFNPLSFSDADLLLTTAIKFHDWLNKPENMKRCTPYIETYSLNKKTRQ